MTRSYRIVPLHSGLDRSGFQCGSRELDDYFQHRVSQDVRRGATACFVLLSGEERIAGFYTLASTSLMLSDLPDSVAKKLPRYPLVPAVLMGRLAVDSKNARQGLGGVLLADALVRVRRSEIAACALVVDAKDEAAAAFYLHHGFTRLQDRRNTLFLPVRRDAIS